MIIIVADVLHTTKLYSGGIGLFTCTGPSEIVLWVTEQLTVLLEYIDH